jgi:hypothetical protein
VVVLLMLGEGVGEGRRCVQRGRGWVLVLVLLLLVLLLVVLLVVLLLMG